MYSIVSLYTYCGHLMHPPLCLSTLYLSAVFFQIQSYLLQLYLWSSSFTHKGWLPHKKIIFWKTGIPSFFLHAYTVSIISLSSETFLWMFTLLLISSFMILSSLDILQLLLTKIHFNSFQSLSIPPCCFLCLNPVKQYTLVSCLMYLMFCNFICP